MIDAKTITSLFLYGTDKKPSNVHDDELIRDKNASTDGVKIDTAEYMSEGPGRFANPILFQGIEKFFNPEVYADSAKLDPGTYDKEALAKLFDIKFFGLQLQQYLFDDGKDNYVERSYIWNTTGFKIIDGVQFHVGESGDRWITNFAIVPYVEEGYFENFDFKAGDGLGGLANTWLQPAIDPSGIGRVVNFTFTGAVPVGQYYTQDSYFESLRQLVPRNEFLVTKLGLEFPSFVTDLWNSGITNTIDSEGRAILYGTSGADALGVATIDNLTIVDPLKRYYIESGKGLALLGGAGDDSLAGSDRDDVLNGGKGNDHLSGGKGLDELLGGEGADVLDGGAGNDILWGGANNDALHGGADDDNLGGESGNDFLNGGSGTDVLNGGDDNDYLLETVGDNFTTMYGDTGNDILEVSAAEGDTILKGGAGNDIILAGGGTNSIEGGNDNDLIRGNVGTDIIDGGNGADNIEGGLGVDAITGGTGADYLRGGVGNDSYFYADANFGTDLIEDTQGNDQLNIEDLRIGSASYDASKLAWIAANGYEIRQYSTGESTTLAINASGNTQNTIYIRNWTAGQFGIVLDGAHSEPQRPDVSLQGATTRAENNYVDYLLSDAGDGGQGNDFVRGSDAASVLAGGSGNDILDGRGGDDWIEGGDGNDVILTGEGKDVALGGAGNDIIRAGYKWDMERGSYVDTGVPVVYYQAGSSAAKWLRTNPRTDIALYYIQKTADGSETTIYVDAHPELALFDVSFEPKLQVNETYSGYMYWWNTGDPDASIEPSLNIKLTLGNSEKVGLGTVAWEDRPSANFGKPLSFELNLGNAKSVLAAGTGEAGALLRGGAGNDVIYGANNSDKLYGEADDDLMVGYDGDDELYGGDGRDELSGGSGRDFLDGGEGNDELIGGFGADVLYGGAGDDALSGDAVYQTGVNWYPAGLDESRMSGDFLDGGSGRDKLWGNNGDDYLYGGDDEDKLYGGLGEDHLFGEAGEDELQGGKGGDYLDGGAQDDLLFGEEGNDILLGGAGKDQLDGGADDDILDGGESDDALIGGAGADILRGGAGADVLFGDAGPGKEGADILEGGAGDDLLNGGGLGDTYIFSVGDGRDTIQDDGTDGSYNSIVFKFGASDVRAVSRAGDDLLVEYGINDSVRVQGFYASNSFGLGYQGSGAEMIDQGAAQARIALINFSDGISWGLDDILAMAPAPLPGDVPPDPFAGLASIYFVNALLSREEIKAAGKHELSFSFVSAFRDGVSNPMPFTEAQQQSVRAALACFSAVLDLRFTEIDDVLGETADLVFQMDDLSSAQMGAFAGYADPMNGRVHVNSTRYGVQVADEFGNMKTRDSLEQGGTGFQMLLHEIGHALGLKHPFEAPLLPRSEDNAGNTVMSYTPVASGAASDLAMFDIAALQYLYGVAKDRQVGDDVYTFATRYVHDAGGVDTFDGSAETRDLSITLEQGGWLHRGAKGDSILAEGQAFIGFGTVIENARGGHGNDTLVGNGGANLLEGGAGNDTLTGGGGDDILAGGAGADTYVFVSSSGHDKVSETGRDTRVVINEVGGNDLYYLDGALYLGAGGDRVEIDLAEVAELIVDDVRYSGAEIAALLEAKVADSDLTLGDGDANGRLLGSGNWRISGNDRANLLHGNAGHNVLEGRAGDDMLVGGTGNDTLSGGLGNDTYVFQLGDGQDVIDNGASDHGQTVDRLQFGSQVAVNDVTLSRADDDLWVEVKGGDRVAVKGYFAAGGEGRIDYIVFADGSVWDDNAISGKVVSAPTEGNDTLSGSAGADLMHGLGGADVLRGHGGDDQLFGDGGNDLLQGATGNDTLVGGTGDDTLEGGAGSDTFVFDRGDGRDRVLSGSDDVGSDIDRVSFGAGIRPGDVTFSRVNDDLVFDAGRGDMVTVAGYFAPGGSKIDLVEFADGSGWTQAFIDQRTATLTGTAGRDVLSGTAAADVIYGLGGDDSLSGNDGDDNLIGGAGYDTLEGGLGSDNYWYARGEGIDIIDNRADDYASATDVIRFADGITASDVRVTRSQDGDLVFTIEGRTLTVTGYYLNDSAKIDKVVFFDGTVLQQSDFDDLIYIPPATYWDDILVGSERADVIDGLDGNDTISGMGGDDFLYGGQGKDILYGGAGNDTLDGGTGDVPGVGTGSDTLVGGEGSDTYLFGDGSRLDSIVESDGKPGDVDVLQLGRGILPSEIVLAREGASLKVQLDGGWPTVSIENQFASADDSQQIEEIRFADGTIWTADAIKRMLIAASVSHLGDDVLGFETGDDIDAGYGDDSIVALGGADSLRGGEGNDTLDGGAGDDVMTGGLGDDIAYGGTGADVYVFARGDGRDIVLESGAATTETDVLRLTNGIAAGDIKLYRMGNDLVFVVSGGVDQVTVRSWFVTTVDGKAADHALERVEFADGTLWDAQAIASRIIVGGSPNTMTGTSGNDVFVVDNPLDVVIEAPNQGTDRIDSSVSYVLPANVENLTLTGTLHIDGSGNSLNNVITGNASDNILSGDASSRDTLMGGLGNDTYIRYGGLGTIQENANAGIDKVIEVGYTGRTYTLAANVEQLDYRADSYQQTIVRANALDNTIWTAAVNTAVIYDGGAGIDTIINRGPQGYFYVDNPRDSIVMAPGAEVWDGSMHVFSTSDYTLGAQLDNLTMMGNAATRGNGNDRDNILNGGADMDPFFNTGVEGETGNNVANVLAGGKGNDTYVLGLGDTIVEHAGEGVDLVYLSFDVDYLAPVTYVMDENVENVNLYFTAATWTLSGNALDNEMNVSGASGSFYGGAGNDTMHAGNSIDAVLDGGEGADLMTGDIGSTTYVVDNAGDRIEEESDSPYWIDTVRASISYQLGANLERLVLIGNAAIDGVGNELDNTVDGTENAAANLLRGGLGSDSYLFGVGAGHDRIDNRAADNATSVDRISLEEGVTSRAIKLSQSGDDLVLRLNDNDSMTVVGYFDDTEDRKIDRLEFGDGSSWTSAEIEARMKASVDGTEAADVLTGSASAEVLNGYGGADTIFGGAGDDVIEGGKGADLLTGGAGSDTYVYWSGDGDDVIDDVSSDHAIATDRLVLNGISAADTAVQRSGVDLIVRVPGGSVTVRGYYDESSARHLDEIVFAGGETWDADQIESHVSLIIHGTAGDDLLTGTANPDMLYGGAGNDTLDGGGDDMFTDKGDTMDGGSGDDVYVLDNPLDVVVELEGGGMDTLLLRATTNVFYHYLLGDHVENAVILGENGFMVSGNAMANRITSGAGDDYLQGGAGADTYVAGAGSGNDIIDDAAPAGNDIDTVVLRGVSSTMLEVTRDYAHLYLASEGGASRVMLANWFDDAAYRNKRVVFDDGVTWNAAELVSRIRVASATDAADTLYGGAGSDTVDGLGGNDEISGYEGADTLNGGAGSDDIFGGDDDDVIMGGDGADYLYGEHGSDVLVGGAGTDHYTVLAGDGVDTIVDEVGDMLTVYLTDFAASAARLSRVGDDLLMRVGDDGVRIANYFTLGLALTVAFANSEYWYPDQIANYLPSEINGTAGADNMNGTSRDDLMNGLAGNDTLSGNAGNDTLDGGAGADQLHGGAGNDTYIVDNSGDIVVESANAGYDRVSSSVSLTLTANVEALTLTGSASINGTGNALANTIDGNAAANVLNGGSGADTLSGGAGNDTYVVDNTADAVIENAGEGVDTVEASVTYTLGANVENLTLTGNAGISATGNVLDNRLVGNSSANTLLGGGGNDFLDGGAGADKLTGGSGNDVYVVDHASDSVTESSADGIDQVQSSLAYTLGANLEALLLTGSGAINGTGNALDNLLVGNAGNNTLAGGAGNDILQGGAGIDILSDTSGKALFDGGIGADSLTGGTGNEMFIGGKGNDTITTSTGADLILFNRGDGQDVIVASASKDNTVSLGGIGYSSLVLQKSGNDLLMSLGSGDQMTFKNWYANANNRSVATLQMVIEDTADYNGNGSALQNRKIQEFDFGGLVGAFDLARAANASLTTWALSSSLLKYHLGGSDDLAYGGSLAYLYATEGTLSGVGLVDAQAVIGAAGFGTTLQQTDMEVTLIGQPLLA